MRVSIPYGEVVQMIQDLEKLGTDSFRQQPRLEDRVALARSLQNLRRQRHQVETKRLELVSAQLQRQQTEHPEWDNSQLHGNYYASFASQFGPVCQGSVDVEIYQVPLDRLCNDLKNTVSFLDLASLIGTVFVDNYVSTHDRGSAAGDSAPAEPSPSGPEKTA
jgi:hypothetical protein